MRRTYTRPMMLTARPDSTDVSALAWLAEQSPTRCISAAWLTALGDALDMAHAGTYPDEVDLDEGWR